jgi:hypothetical protein
MQRHGELDHPEAGAQVTAGNRYRIDRFRTQLVGNLSQVPGIDTPQIGRTLDQVQELGIWLGLISNGRRHATNTLQQ